MSASDPVAAAKSVEQAEEDKLRQKYPNLGRKGIGTSVLQKRLNKGHKYFDSGDYNMAKARVSHQKAPLPATQEKEMLQESTGDTIPTPDNVPAVRKKSSVNSCQTDQHQVTHPDQPIVAQHLLHQQQHQQQLQQHQEKNDNEEKKDTDKTECLQAGQ